MPIKPTVLLAGVTEIFGSKAAIAIAEKGATNVHPGVYAWKR